MQDTASHNIEGQSFEKAYNRLKEIHTMLHTSDILDVDKILLLQEEAKELHSFLLQRLSTISPNQSDENS